MLAGLVATPALAATVPAAAQGAGPRWTPQQAKDALKDAKGTKLVLLGTAAGPVPGRSRQMTSHVMLSNGAAYVLDCGMGVTDNYAPAIDSITDDGWRAPVAKYFKGEIIVGKDLMVV
jgi:ribonuclease BN (tRNA processing enzyme)